jgi:hypothetical protein
MVLVPRLVHWVHTVLSMTVDLLPRLAHLIRMVHMVNPQRQALQKWLWQLPEDSPKDDFACRKDRSWGHWLATANLVEVLGPERNLSERQLLIVPQACFSNTSSSVSIATPDFPDMYLCSSLSLLHHLLPVL